MALKWNLHIYTFNYLFVKKSLHIKKVVQVFKSKTDSDVNIMIIYKTVKLFTKFQVL